ncbi:MAG: hypothetical protein ABR66_04000 [Microbacteriaceae bacterium BACL25 MAG-120322-bin65]|nr:MAG: hypothetical protein ABR66_04000 [Microbacteriaceae bacterium BACL25 MAG-120322-bin65]
MSHDVNDDAVDVEVDAMGGKKKSKNELPERQPILDALMDSPDVQSVLRLGIASEPDGHLVMAATLQLIDSLPIYVISHTLDDAKRRIRGVVGDTVEVYLEPELVRDPAQEQPATDVIVIKASD